MAVSDLTLNQRFAVAKAYLNHDITVAEIAELSGISTSEVASLAEAVLGPQYFQQRMPRRSSRPVPLLECAV